MFRRRPSGAAQRGVSLTGCHESATRNGADAREGLVGRHPEPRGSQCGRVPFAWTLQFHTSPLEEMHEFVVEITDGQVVSGPAVEDDWLTVPRR